MGKKEDIILLSTAEWDNPFWTNKQHVAVELAKRGHRVFYIDSLGLRRPSASSQDVGRIIKRLKKALKAPREVRKNLWVWSPILLPFQSNEIIRRFNYLLLNRWLDFWLKRLEFDHGIFWTYNPLTTHLFDIDKYHQLVYHCVDEIKAQPGMPVDLLEEAEKELLEKSDVVFTTSKHLYKTRSLLNPNTYYFSNVADYEHFSKALESGTTIPHDIQDIPAPRIGFIGAISGYKVDFSLLSYLAEKFPMYSFVLIGKVGEGDPWTEVDNLKKMKNIHFLGPKNYAELPGYLKGMDVAILPNRLNEYTRSMFPMKFFEYLAAGKPVVSVDLDALRDFGDIVCLAKNKEMFASCLEKAVREPEDKLQERLALAKEYTYETRMDKMMRIVEGLQ